MPLGLKASLLGSSLGHGGSTNDAGQTLVVTLRGRQGQRVPLPLPFAPFTSQVLQRLERQRTFREVYGRLLGSLWALEAERLDQATFVSSVLRLTAPLTEEEFFPLLLGVEQVLEEIITRQEPHALVAVEGLAQTRQGKGLTLGVEADGGLGEGTEAEMSHRREAVAALFPKWDLNGDSIIDEAELVQVQTPHPFLGPVVWFGREEKERFRINHESRVPSECVFGFGVAFHSTASGRQSK